MEIKHKQVIVDEVSIVNMDIETAKRTTDACRIVVIGDTTDNENTSHSLPYAGKDGTEAMDRLIGVIQLQPERQDDMSKRFLNPERMGMPDIDIDSTTYLIEKRGQV